MLKEISIEITRKCPNKCVYCSSLSDIDCKEILDFDLFVNIIDDACKLGANTICLSGGEPFIHPNIIDMINYVNGKKLNCYIYSSGIILDENNNFAPIEKKLLAPAAGKITKIIFNIEAGTEQTYNYIMGTTGCFNIMRQSIKNAGELSIVTEAHFVPMKPNLNEIEKTIELCKELSVSKISFLRLVVHGRALTNKDSIDLNNDELERIKSKLAELKSGNNMDIRIGIPLSDKKECHRCEAASGKINIRYDGCVFPCEVFKNEITGIQLNGFKPENIRHNSLIDIYNNSSYLQYVRDYSSSYKQGNYSETCVGQYLLTCKDN